jgi:hypothetical protein
VSDTPELLTVDDAATLMEFARACKAAARAVLLYPAGHPAIAATLGRIVHITSAEVLRTPLRLTVRPDGLLLDDRAPARADAAIAELALLFHSHLIGQATVHPGGDSDAWHSFLLLLGRAPESIRADGGIARAWTAMARGHIELREIDYAEVLRERSAGESAVWHRILDQCLRGDAFDLGADGVRELLDVAGDAGRLADVMSALDKTTGSTESTGAIGAKSAAVLRMLRALVDAVSATDPARLEPVLRNMAAAIGHLSPDTLLELLHRRDDHAQAPQLMNAVVSRMSDGTISRFVARHVAADGSATDRLALAFQALVPDQDHQQRLLALAHDDVAASPLGGTDDFPATWDHIAKQLLTSYSDEPYVTGEYARELTSTQAHALDVEHVSDDPPERVTAWLSTVATTALRALDLSLLLDLLRIEQDEERWGALMTPLVRLLEDLLLVGDFDAAHDLIAVLVREAGSDRSIERRQHALIGIDMLVAGPLMRHVTTHLGTADDAQFATIKAMCVSVGDILVKPLAETLSSEDRPQTRERLTSILRAFGSVGRRTIERLKTSENPAVRRTAIYLIREFGGSHALPDLTELLGDTEPQVQRAAIRAILTVGTDEAFRILERALATGSHHAREAIMQSIGAVRDERATPLFVYILRRVDHRGPLAAIYVRAIESLGALRDPAGIGSLRDVLFRGEWWAPRRTAALRSAAAGALARIGTPDALSVLHEAATRGSRRVRAAARPHLPARGRRAETQEDRS